MPSPPNNWGGRKCVCLALAIVSLGAAGDSLAQMVNTKAPEPKKPQMEGFATWYKVPRNSRTKQRAGKDELTAANNHLPFGTKVRVTNLGNGKSVVVRITDRGVYRRGTVIDLCKEAAEQLDMLREGSTRVRLEALSDDKVPASKTKAASW
ncbi:MAG TPA: septal ring lytic transglycosylase RlpA family protein [Chthoniobacterales bacterium]|nr:septal ring lytic transglycosylase RlpA family protein [Chthoniobacterales bacterium]